MKAFYTRGSNSFFKRFFLSVLLALTVSACGLMIKSVEPSKSEEPGFVIEGEIGFIFNWFLPNAAAAELRASAAYFEASAATRCPEGYVPATDQLLTDQFLADQKQLTETNLTREATFGIAAEETRAIAQTQYPEAASQTCPNNLQPHQCNTDLCATLSIASSDGLKAICTVDTTNSPSGKKAYKFNFLTKPDYLNTAVIEIKRKTYAQQNACDITTLKPTEEVIYKERTAFEGLQAFKDTSIRLAATAATTSSFDSNLSAETKCVPASSNIVYRAKTIDVTSDAKILQENIDSATTLDSPIKTAIATTPSITLQKYYQTNKDAIEAVYSEYLAKYAPNFDDEDSVRNFQNLVSTQFQNVLSGSLSNINGDAPDFPQIAEETKEVFKSSSNKTELIKKIKQQEQFANNAYDYFSDTQVVEKIDRYINVHYNELMPEAKLGLNELKISSFLSPEFTSNEESTLLEIAKTEVAMSELSGDMVYAEVSYSKATALSSTTSTVSNACNLAIKMAYSTNYDSRIESARIALEERYSLLRSQLDIADKNNYIAMEKLSSINNELFSFYSSNKYSIDALAKLAFIKNLKSEAVANSFSARQKRIDLILEIESLKYNAEIKISEFAANEINHLLTQINSTSADSFYSKEALSSMEITYASIETLKPYSQNLTSLKAELSKLQDNLQYKFAYENLKTQLENNYLEQKLLYSEISFLKSAQFLSKNLNQTILSLYSKIKALSLEAEELELQISSSTI